MDYLLKKKNLIKKELSPNCNEKISAINPEQKSKNDRSSPSDEKCPICLAIPIENKSFANKCFHSFCKFCIIEWSKVRMECPLCRQPFDRLIYDVKSEYDFKELTMEDLARIKISEGSHSGSIPILSPFLNMFPLGFRNAFSDSTVLSNQYVNRTLVVGTIEHRRYIYATDQFVVPCGNGNTSRRREASARFFRLNPACIHRLVPFLNLELRALIYSENERNVVFQLILKSLTCMDINSSRFQALISQFTVHRTVHFIHELYNFAISTYDNISLYFQDAIYVPRSQTTVVRINYNSDSLDEEFDLSDPYNYRNSRHPRISDGPFVNRTVSNRQSRDSSTNENDTSRTNNLSSVQVQDLEDSDDGSDDDVVFEGRYDQSSHSKAPVMVHDSKSIDNVQNVTLRANQNNQDDDPSKPSTSGLQNNIKLHSSKHQLFGQDSEDSDYDDDAYKRNFPRTPFYESDDDHNQNRSEPRDDHNTDSIEYIGSLRPKRIRTSDSSIEVIELTDDESINSRTEPINLSKKFKNDHKNDKTSVEYDIKTPININEKAVNCRCKIMCKYVCKKSD